MKLRLEEAKGVKILKVTDHFELPHVEILRAGLAKLYKSDNKVKAILLDLTGVTEASDEALKATLNLKSFAASLMGLLMIASPVKGIGDAPDRDGALEKLSSPLAAVLALEANLKARLTKLQRQKSTLEAKHNPEAMKDFIEIKKRNSDLKKSVHELEEHVKKLYGERTDFVRSPDNEAKLADVRKVLKSVLEAAGISTQ